MRALELRPSSLSELDGFQCRPLVERDYLICASLQSAKAASVLLTQGYPPGIILPLRTGG
jgi:hypothetical protein